MIFNKISFGRHAPPNRPAFLAPDMNGLRGMIGAYWKLKERHVGMRRLSLEELLAPLASTIRDDLDELAKLLTGVSMCYRHSEAPGMEPRVVIVFNGFRTDEYVPEQFKWLVTTSPHTTTYNETAGAWEDSMSRVCSKVTVADTDPVDHLPLYVIEHWDDVKPGLMFHLADTIADMTEDEDDKYYRN